MDQYDDSLPRARAGHCSVAVSVNRCYTSFCFVFLTWSIVIPKTGCCYSHKYSTIFHI